MKLLTKALEQQFKKIGGQSKVKDPIVVAKFFYPAGAATWYATEYHPSRKIFYGFVTLGLGEHCDEWGEFALDELQSFKGSFGLGIERDLHFEEQPISKLMPHAVI